MITTDKQSLDLTVIIVVKVADTHYLDGLTDCWREWFECFVDLTIVTEPRPQPQARHHDSSAYLRGWIGYFGFCQTPAVLRDLDRWIRHRLRCLQWKHGKIYHSRKAELIKRGINPQLAHTTAWSAKGPWKISHTPGVRMALNNHFFDQMGLIRLSAHYNM